MLSLEGPHETVLIPAAEGHEPGRVGSALSMRSEIAEENYDEDEDENDEEHHHDDIVEHLDVIGMCLPESGQGLAADPCSACRPPNSHSVNARERSQFHCHVSTVHF